MRARPVFTVVLLLSLLALGQSPGTNQQSAPAPPDPILSMPFLGLAPPHYQAEFTPVLVDGPHHWLSWDKGYLVSYEVGGSNHRVTVYDKAGKWIFEDPLNLENAFKVFNQDAIATSLGTAMVAISVVNGDGASADMIVKVAKGGIRGAVRTNPFYPIKLCATDEETVWAYGMEMTADRFPAPRAHYPMLREYSFEKGELRTALDRATVRPPKGSTLKGSGEELQMICTKGRVVIVNGAINELEEYDLAASTLMRWPIQPLPQGFAINGAAITDSGEIYVSVVRKDQKPLTGILRLRLNPSGTVDWTPLTIVPPVKGGFFLFGNDGDDLVYAWGLGAPTLLWSPTGEVGGTK